MRSDVLGLPVDVLNRRDVSEKISKWIENDNDLKLLITAYSEFFVKAQSDKEFFEVMKSADMVTPDGVSVLAAVSYLRQAKGRTLLGKLACGLRTGGNILSGKIGETVTGVWLFEELTKKAAERGWKVFLLGGWGGVSERVAKRLLKRFPGLKVAYDSGEERVGTDEKKNREVIDKINKFRPDILFVSYNPIKQEKWLAKHRHELKVKIGIGVGGTYNEYMGEFKKAPRWMEKMGLKWLWRVWVEPKRFGRIMKAVFVFPWLVFRNS